MRDGHRQRGDVISISTPVAHAPPCELTSAPKAIVTTAAIPVMISDSGAARAQSGAMPYRGWPAESG